MSLIRENIVPVLVGSLLSGLGALALSIYSDFLPVLIPALQQVPPQTYAKIIILLALVLVVAAALAIAIYVRTKPYRPRALLGKMFGFRWSAELDYTKKREEVEIAIQWFCPRHAVFLGIKPAQIPETSYHNLWCAKCSQKLKKVSGTIDFLGHSDVKTTMIYTHVLNRGPAGVRSPVDGL